MPNKNFVQNFLCYTHFKLKYINILTLKSFYFNYKTQLQVMQIITTSQKFIFPNNLKYFFQLSLHNKVSFVAAQLVLGKHLILVSWSGKEEELTNKYLAFYKFHFIS